METKRIVLLCGSASPELAKLEGLEAELRPFGVEWGLDRSMPTHIDPARCSGCRACEVSCPAACLRFDPEKRVMHVNKISCKGCGSCVATCPSAVAVQAAGTDRMLFAAVESVLGDGADVSGRSSSPTFRVQGVDEGVPVVCFLREHEAEAGLVVDALEAGCDGVIVGADGGAEFEPGHGHEVVRTVRRVLAAAGISPLRVEALTGSESELANMLLGFCSILENVGPNPIRSEMRP